MTVPSDIWVITDGAAGNEKQALALANALGRGISQAPHPDIPQEQDNNTFRLATRVPWRWTAPHLLPREASAFGSSIAPRLIGEPPHIAIGCGRQAALALRWLGRRHGSAIRTVQILDPRIDPRHFDAVIVPEHDALCGPNVLTTLGALNTIDDASLAHARDAWPALQTLPTPRTAVLLGGPTRAVPFDRNAWHTLATHLRALHACDGGSLLVTTSRRSPDWLRQAARDDLADIPGTQWHGESDGANPYTAFLALADRIVVTPDSVNLLSEACATRVPVWIPDPTPIPGKIGHFVDTLIARGRVHLLGTPAPLQASVEPLRETKRIAADLRRVLMLD